MHILERERNHSNTKSFSLSKVRIRNFFFDLKLIRTRITCFSFIDLKFIRTRIICFSFIVLKLIRTRIICFNWKFFVKRNLSLLSLTWNSFAHEIFASRLIWFQHFCLITLKWFDFYIFAWSHRNDLKNHYNRDFRIWQTRVDRDVCRNRLTHLSLNDLLIKSSELTEISMMLWQELFVNSSHCWNHSIACFETSIFTRTNLVVSKWCRISAFKAFQEYASSTWKSERFRILKSH